MPDLLPFVRDVVAVPRLKVAPELAYLSAVSFARLRDVLQAAVPFFLRRRAFRSRSGVPELFYFDRARDAELSGQPRPPDEADRKAATAEPTAHRAASLLPDLLDDVLTLTHHGPALRRVLRATDRLVPSVEAWACEHPKLERLRRVAAVADDEVLRLIDPTRRTGVRFAASGIETIRDLHVVLAESSGEDSLQLSDDGDEVPFEPSRQFLRPSALQRGRSLEGWAAVDHWLWGMESLRTLPRLDGERLILSAEPTIRTMGNPTASATGIRPEIEWIEDMTPTDVDTFLKAWTGTAAEPRLRRAA